MGGSTDDITHCDWLLVTKTADSMANMDVFYKEIKQCFGLVGVGTIKTNAVTLLQI